MNILPNTITSILNQTYTDFELIVIDDASTDGTAEYLKQLSERDKRVRVITHEKSRERIISYLEGYRAAKGEWICSQASDDEFVYVFLEQMDFNINKYPDKKMFYFGYIMVNQESVWTRPVRQLEDDPEPGWGMKYFDKGTIQGMCSVVFHRSLVPVFDAIPEIDNVYDFANWFGTKTEEYWKERGLPGEPPIKYNKDDSWCGNPWGDDHVFGWFLTRKNKAQFLDIRPTLVYDRHISWLYERAKGSGVMGEPPND